MVNRDQLSIEQAWQNWIMCLKGEDKNSIFAQIRLMLWDTAIFHVLWKSHKEKCNKNSRGPRLNEHFFSFIFRNYFHAQSAYVRRITDPKSKLTGDYGAYSLGAIIRNLLKYRDELTREKFIELRGFPYEYLTIIEKEKEFILDQAPGKAVWVPREFDWETIRDAHETFDRLSQTIIENREPTDLINENLLDRLIHKLDDCEKINQYVNKFVAHSATIESRSLINIDEYKLTLNNIWKAQEIIYKVANFLSVVLFSIDNMPLVIEHPSFFAHWDKSFFDEGEAFDKVHTTLEGYREETEAWMASSIKDVWFWIER